MKEFTSLLCGIIMCVATNTAFAQSGETGTLHWEITDGMLTITGEGAMPDYEGYPASAQPPRWSFRATITSVAVGDGVTRVGNSAFADCSGLTSVTIGNSVVLIGNNALFDCTDLISVTIGNSVTTIGDRAFSYCTSLTEITNLATTPQAIEASVFNGVNKSACTLCVPEGSQEAYRSADVWKYFLNIEGITVGINNNIFTGITVYSNGNTVYIVNENSVTLKLVQILDVLGRVVYSGKANGSVTIPVNGAGGIYIVKLISDDNKVLSAKVHLND